MTISQRNKSFIPLIFLILFVSLSNFWIFRIFEYNFLIGEFILIETFLLLLITFYKTGRALIILIFLLLVIQGSALFINHFDRNIFSTSTIELMRINKRQQFYAQELGKIYQNRIGIYYFDNLRIYFSKISSNFFSNLDLSFYFSPSSIIDNGRYALFFAPLLLVGLIYLLTIINKVHILYFLIALIISAFINLDSKLGPILILPIINLCIVIGLVKFMEIFGIKSFKK